MWWTVLIRGTLENVILKGIFSTYLLTRLHWFSKLYVSKFSLIHPSANNMTITTSILIIAEECTCSHCHITPGYFTPTLNPSFSTIIPTHSKLTPQTLIITIFLSILVSVSSFSLFFLLFLFSVLHKTG